MRAITADTLVGDIKENDLLNKAFGFFAYPAYDGPDADSLTLKAYLAKSDSAFMAGDSAGAMNLALKQAETHRVFYRYDESRSGSYLLHFTPKENTRGPIFVIPGGGYSTVCGIYEGAEVGQAYADLGYDVYIVSYGVLEEARYPKVMDDLGNAIGFARKQFELGDDYRLVGFSASGHLAGLFCSEGVGYRNYSIPKPRCLVLGYPVITLEEGTHGGTRDNFLGEERKDDKAMQKAFSVDSNIGPSYPPTFLWRSADDPAVSGESNADRMDEALKRNHVPHVYHVYPGFGHGWAVGKGTSAEGWIKESALFMDAHSGR